MSYPKSVISKKGGTYIMPFPYLQTHMKTLFGAQKNFSELLEHVAAHYLEGVPDEPEAMNKALLAFYGHHFLAGIDDIANANAGKYHSLAVHC